MSRWKQALGAVLALSIIVVGGVFLAESIYPSAADISLRGTLTVGGQGSDIGGVYEGDSCGGRKEFADILAGAKAVIYDGQTTILLGASELEPGRIDAFGNCVFRFGFTSVNKANSYAVEVANRGLHQFSYKNLAAKGFAFTLNLGNVSKTKLPERTTAKGVSSSKKYQLQDLTSDQNVKQ